MLKDLIALVKWVMTTPAPLPEPRPDKPPSQAIQPPKKESNYQMARRLGWDVARSASLMTQYELERVIVTSYHERAAVLEWRPRPEGGADLVGYHHTGEVEVLLLRQNGFLEDLDFRALVEATERHGGRGIIITRNTPSSFVLDRLEGIGLEVRGEGYIISLIEDLERRGVAY